MKSAIELITDERKRQIEKGFDSKHDDQHGDISLLGTAVKIASDVLKYHYYRKEQEWEREVASHVWDKYGGDYIKRLTVAGALIVAEIERLQRSENV